MKQMLILLTLFALLALSLSAIIKTKRPIDGEYIIELNRDANLHSFIRSKSFKSKSGEVVSLEQNIMDIYERTINGFSARLSDDQVLELEGMPEVMRVSANGKTRFASYVTEENAPWDLARLSSWYSLPSSGPYSYTYDSSAGNNVNLYIIDTGIDDSNNEFQDGLNRVIHMGLPGMSTGDSDGHGTAVASLAGGMTLGVSPLVWLLDVKCTETADGVTYSNLITCIEIACNDSWNTYIFQSSVMLIALDPLDAYDALDAAITTAYLDYCIVVVVSAGNSGTATTCTLSPTRAPYSLVVTASDINDNIWSNTNYGRCVDFVAPGVDVLFADISCTTCTNTDSGTSYSAAIGAGLVAYFIAYFEICLCDDAWYDFWYYANPNIYMPWYPLFDSPLIQSEAYWNTFRGSKRNSLPHTVNETQRFAARNMTAANKVKLSKEIRHFMGKNRHLMQHMSKKFN